MPPRARCRSPRPKGRWLVPPDRAVWVPALARTFDRRARRYRDAHAVFRSGVAGARAPSASLDAEFVVRVSRLLHEAILALFDGRNDPDRTELLIRLAMLELHQAEDSATFIPLPHEPRCRRAADIVLGDPTGAHEIETLARTVGTSARTLSRLFASETQLSFKSWCQRARIAAAIENCRRGQPLGQATGLGSRLCQRAGVFPCLPAGHRQDADGVFGDEVSGIWPVAGSPQRCHRPR
jgi:AraC-like DNA-binding protein